MTREPSDVVTAAGSYHSRLLVAYKLAPFRAYGGCGKGEKYPVMEVYRLPVGVIPRIEGTTVSIEFIGENEDHLAAIFIRWYAVQVDRGVLVNQTKISYVRYLSGCISIDAVPTAFMGEFGRGKVYDHRVSNTEGGVIKTARGSMIELTTK